MKRSLIILLLIVISLYSFSQKKKPATQTYYYPGNEWQHKTPEDVGMDAAKVKEAIDFALSHETKSPRSMEQNHYQTFGKEPFGDAIGPMKDRGAPTGIIVKNGYVIAEWGEPLRPDMTHSVTKSFLSATVGLAYDHGLIKSISDTVHTYMAPIHVYSPIETGNKADRFGKSELLDLFSTPHNRTITWNDLLRQTSDWEGTLWGKPDWADRPSANTAEWLTRKRNTPGTTYEYNDTRVNVLALATLNVWRKPLPQVLKENIMDEISASSTWRWYGYDNAWVVLDGNVVQSVSGGGHWGGGMIINAYDLARFGYLTLRNGKWNDKQLISEQWLKWSAAPTTAQIGYGFMNYFLNTDKKYLPSAPSTAFTHIGNGTNMIYVDKENDIVAVVRWIDNASLDGFVNTLLKAIK
jgi:CubicO group peptidase (beta-lactamase class C family)